MAQLVKIYIFLVVECSRYMYVRGCQSFINILIDLLFMFRTFPFAVRKVCLQSGMHITRDDDFNRYVNMYNYIHIVYTNILTLLCTYTLPQFSNSLCQLQKFALYTL